MRILLLTQWFDPEPTFKGLLFATALRDMGHEVTVLTGFPNYPGGRIYEGHKQRLLKRETIDGISVYRVPLYPSHDSSPIRRILNYGSFAASSTLVAPFLKRPDVVYVYHPPATAALGALALKALRGVPFVIDVQDLWPDTLRATGMITNEPVLRLAGRLMTRIYSSAAHVIVLSRGFANAVAPLVGDRKVTVVANWADEVRMSPLEKSSTIPPSPFSKDQFNVVFAGTMGRAQALTTVMDAAEIMADENVRFILVGGGIDLEHLRENAARRGLDRKVVFLPRRPAEEISTVLQNADALLVHLRDDPLFGITIPSKTQAYLMAGRPILMGVRGDAASIVADADAGMLFEPENAESLAEAVRAIVAVGPRRRDEMGQKGRDYYWANLSLEVGSKAIEAVLADASLTQGRVELFRRAWDVCLAGIGLISMAAPFAIVAALIRWKLGTPVIFRQERPGRHNKPFEMFKFRTMTDARDASGRLLPDSLRITPLGTAIRSLSLDELPTLVNVLRGEMSIVGPRPLLPRYTPFFTPAEARRLDVRPGVTGLAQVNGRNTASWDERLGMDSWYVENRSFRLDLKILARTVVNVVRRSGFVADPRSAMRDLDDERSLRSRS